MLYTNLRIWDHDGQIWHALFRPGTRDLSMGVLQPHEVNRIIAWARSQMMVIADERKLAA